MSVRGDLLSMKLRSKMRYTGSTCGQFFAEILTLDASGVPILAGNQGILVR